MSGITPDVSGRTLKKLRTIANYQFGKGAGRALFSDGCDFMLSSSGHVRQIFENGKRIATLRAQDGLFTLGIEGAKKLHAAFPCPRLRVTMRKDVTKFISDGKSAFAKHIVDVDDEIRVGEEVLLVDENDNLIATGQAVLCADEMRCLRRGVAVRVRDRNVI